MTRMAYFDPYAGASGEMVLGALLDCGLALEDLRAGLAGLGLTGWTLTAERVRQHGLCGTRATIELASDETERDWTILRALLTAGTLPEPAQAAALAIVNALTTAEAQTQGVQSETVQLSQLGGAHALVAIVGAALGLQLLGVERVYSSAPALGVGFTTTREGVVSVPAPVTARLLVNAGAPSRATHVDNDIDAELLTPIGAAILTTVAEFTRPTFSADAVGYGFGQHALPWPDALPLWLGDVSDVELARPATVPARATELLFETNIDDMHAEFYELLLERLLAAGALDAWLTPISWRGGRPATTVSAISVEHDRARIEAVFFQNTSTVEVRAVALERTRLAQQQVTVTTRWGDVRLELRIWRGRVLEAVPDHGDCLAVARHAEAPLRVVYAEAQRQGDVFVGQRLSNAEQP